MKKINDFKVTGKTFVGVRTVHRLTANSDKSSYLAQGNALKNILVGRPSRTLGEMANFPKTSTAALAWACLIFFFFCK